jgi:hypothetical protein
MVGARGNLWDHATKWCVDRRLARHAFCEHLATTANQGNGTLIATRFNRQQ